jgi:hypothetical protein
LLPWQSAPSLFLPKPSMSIFLQAKPLPSTPDQSLGSSLDILPAKQFEKIFSPGIIKQSLSAGWGPITYRQNTELTIAAWHWNPNGTWSDAQHKSGYFTGSAEPNGTLRMSYGYPLPHRGNTRNGGASHGYARLTDGDPASYWKSNPYLASKYTGERDALHPQWMVIDFASPQPIDALHIAWAEPCATKFTVQYWAGSDDPMNKPLSGNWITFPQGEFTNGKGGSPLLRLASQPIKCRSIRVWMTESSNTCDTHGSGDPRNCVRLTPNSSCRERLSLSCGGKSAEVSGSLFPGATREKFIEKQACQARGVMPNLVPFIEQAPQQNLHSHVSQTHDVDRHLRRAFFTVSVGHDRRHLLAVGHDVINDARPNVILNRPQVSGN